MKNLKCIAVFCATAFFIVSENFAQIYTPGGIIQGSTGNNSIGIGTSTPSVENSLQINRTGTGSYSRAIATYVTPQNTAPMGLYANVYSSTPLASYRTYGVVAEVGNATSGWNYAIVGRILGTNNGAAIVGLTPGRDVLNVGGMWAAYLRGNVYIEDKLAIGTTTPNSSVKFDINGNLGVNGAICFGGTSGNYYDHISYESGVGIVFKTGPVAPTMKIRQNLVEIGCSAGSNLNVNGKIQAKELEIKSGPCSDFVFEKDYSLMTLHELESFVQSNKHLPEVPSAEEFQSNGYNVGEFDDMLLRKIEELTLYIIEQNKRIESLEIENSRINAQLSGK